MTEVSPLIASPSFTSLKVDLYGNPLINSKESKELVEQIYSEVGELNHKYYREELNHPLGPSGVIDTYDVGASLLLWMSEKGPATMTNFFVTVAEYLQTFIARTKLFGDPNQEGKEGKIALDRREGATAWIQVLTGTIGLGRFFSDLLFGEKEDSEEKPFLKKAGLSLLALTGAAGMFFTYIEKALLCVTSKGKKVGNECKGIKMNFESDARTVADWLTLAIYPWAQSMKPLRSAIDFVIPYLAMRSGLKHMKNEGVSKVFNKEENFEMSEGVKGFLKHLFLMGNNGDLEHYSVPKFLATNSFLGEGGIRDKYLVPLLKLFGCKSIPQVNIVEDSVQERSLVIRPDVQKILGRQRKLAIAQ